MTSSVLTEREIAIGEWTSQFSVAIGKWTYQFSVAIGEWTSRFGVAIGVHQLICKYRTSANSERHTAYAQNTIYRLPAQKTEGTAR